MFKDWKKGFDNNFKVVVMRDEVEAFVFVFEMSVFTKESIDI